MHGGFGYGDRNQEGEDILNFAVAYDLMIANNFFRKRLCHLVTFSSGQHSSQIDFVLVRREDKRTCIDCKVILGECVVQQHKLVVSDFHFRTRVRQAKVARATRTKWWKLKGDASQAFKERMIAEGIWNVGEANSMWTEMASRIRKVATEVLGVTRVTRCEPKDTWWWNEEVQKAIEEKKTCYKHMHHDRSNNNVQKYKAAKKKAKKAVSEARGKAYEEIYQKL